MAREPVVEHSACLLGNAADDHGRLRGAEGVVVDEDLRPGDVGVVLAVASAVHVKAMAERRAEFDIVSRLIAAAGPAGAGDGVAIGVEQVAFDQ